MVNISRLRCHVAGQKIFSTADLHKEMHDLTVRIREQQGIILSLSFRYLLEKLPPDEPGTATDKWKKFWDNIWEKGRDSTNPKLKAMIEKYKNPRRGPTVTDAQDTFLQQIDAIGKNLYGTLSTDIHKYHRGKVELTREMVLHEQTFDILQLLMPDAGLNTDLNWDVVRSDLGYEGE